MTCPTISTLHAILAAYDAPAGPSKADTIKAVAECLAGLSPSCADLEKQLATEAATGAAHVGELLAMQGAANINIPVLGAVAWFHRGEVNFDMQSALRLLDDGKGMPISLYIGAQPVAAQGEQDALLVALTKIARWELPDIGLHWNDGTPMSYGGAFGANGERDYMRQIASDAILAAKGGAQ